MHCTGVEDRETWQEYLSLLVEQDVYNFGTGGYGTDQAYLKFLEIYPKVKTPIIILGLTTENINRIANVYRPFYFLTGLKLTKPRFKIVKDKLILLKNPIRNKDEIMKLQNLRFINEIGQNDFWYNRNNYPIFKFPYSKIIINKRLWLEIIWKIKGHKIDDICPQPWSNLWENKEATDIMFKIFESFVNKVESEKAIPIIMVIPEKSEVLHKLKRGIDIEKTLKIIEFCNANNLLYFSPINGFVDYVKAENDVDILYNGHISSRGNQIIADQLFKYLKNISDF